MSAQGWGTPEDWERIRVGRMMDAEDRMGSPAPSAGHGPIEEVLGVLRLYADSAKWAWRPVDPCVKEAPVMQAVWLGGCWSRDGGDFARDTLHRHEARSGVAPAPSAEREATLQGVAQAAEDYLHFKAPDTADLIAALDRLDHAWPGWRGDR